MKLNSVAPLTILVVVFLVSGCERSLLTEVFSNVVKSAAPQQAGQSNLTAVAVEDPELAKLIMRQDKQLPKITRDPFYPVYAPAKISPDAKLIDPKDLVDVQFQQVTYFGSIRSGAQHLAYISVKGLGKVFKVGDVILGYTIKSIDAKQVVFRSGDKEVVKKRGGK